MLIIWFKMVDNYNMKIPRELADLFQRYINEHEELGFRKISQFVLHILREEAKKLIDKMK